MQQLLPDEKVRSEWGRVYSADLKMKDYTFCYIEENFQRVLDAQGLEYEATFGQIVDALELYYGTEP